MQNSKVSIIVSAYNAEKNIEQCINSIENQTYKDIEIIIINDGSKDNTQKISENLKKIYKNIIVVNQENKGVSQSRNTGIDKATGEYIMFVDSDDFIEKNMIETILKNKENDLTISNYKRYYGKDKIINNIEIDEKIYNKEEFLENFWNLYNTYLINSPCFRIYRKDIIVLNEIKFNPKYELGEDLIFNLEYLNYCNKICVINKYLYNYRYSENSLTTKYRKNYLEIQFQLIKFIEDFFEENNHMNEKNKKEIDKIICDVIISSIQNLFLESSYLSHKEKKAILKQYVNLKETEKLQNVVYNEKRLQFLQKLILKKKVDTIIIYSELKEILKKLLGR